MGEDDEKKLRAFGGVVVKLMAELMDAERMIAEADIDGTPEPAFVFSTPDGHEWEIVVRRPEGDSDDW